MSDTDNFLAHYGVKGMKWGVRKKRGVEVSKVKTTAQRGQKVTAKGGTGQKPSPDAVRTAVLKQKAKASTTDSLSTKELKALTERMQLEKKYSELTPATGTDKARKFVSDLVLNSGKQNAQNAINNTISEQVAKVMAKKK